MSLGSLRPPLRNIKLKRRGQALFPNAPASQKKRLHVASEVCSASDLQLLCQACCAAFGPEVVVNLPCAGMSGGGGEWCGCYAQAASHISTDVQEVKQACDELEDGEEECQSRPKLPAEHGLPPITAGALTYPFPTAAHSAWSQRPRAGPGYACGVAELPLPPAHAFEPPKQVWPAQLQPSLARFLLTEASNEHAAEVRCGYVLSHLMHVQLRAL